tara:strand:+ start:1230 stop:1976 length:747 start_codon:yes stop_codon:yes gene_type:complete
MKVSIITATFNSAESIRSCLDSVLNQNYNDLEYLIIDGKSHDKTLTIINNLANNFKEIKIISEKDKGIYDALNKGIKLATGDIIGFIHSDDFLNSKNIIGDIVSMIKNENFDGVYGDLQYVEASNTQKVLRNWISSEFTHGLLKEGWMPAHPTLFLKKEVYKKHGLFDLDFKISADYDFILRVFNDFELRFGYLPKIITKMRLGGISNNNLKNIILKTREDYIAIKKNKVGNFLTLIRKNTSKLKQFL